MQCCLDEHSECLRFQVNCPVGVSWHSRHCSTHPSLPTHHFHRSTWYAPVTRSILLKLMYDTKARDITLIQKYLLIRATLICLLMSCGILKQFYAENTGALLTKTLPLPSCKYWAILQSMHFFYILYSNNYFLLQADLFGGRNTYIVMKSFYSILSFHLWTSKNTYVFYVYWTVHHCSSWRIKDQLDVTCYFISLLMCSTCFGH